MDNDFWQALPDEVETETYRSFHRDLAHLPHDDLLAHYETYGRGEGRTSNRLRDRNDFTALIPSGANVLEIGPFCNPLLRGPHVSYFDVLSQDELIARARLIGLGLDPAGVPHIDYVSPTGDLSTVNRRFDVVASSHCLEHQPDLVGHLQDVGRLLLPGGAYFLLVPDKRYCFDYFIPLSSLAEIMIARHERRRVHTLRSVIEHRALTTHNDSLRHWHGDHGVMFENFEQRLQVALREFDDAKGGHIDVHAWYFTPESASAILAALQNMRLSPLAVHRVYATRYGANEFWMILRK
jgi:SAM-dependent methyltransferase